VLCNGIGTRVNLFDALVAELDPARPVVRFDPPGIGASAAPVLPYRYSTLAAAVRSVVGELGYDRADILGISWGGALAQQYAFQYPRHCRRLVLVATTPGTFMVPAHPRVLRWMLTPRRHRDPDFARAIAGRLYGGSARADPAGALHALHHDGLVPSIHSYLYQVLALWGWTSLPFLPLIRQPALVLTGDDDPLIPGANATMLSTLLGHGRLHRYPGGHLALLTHPDRLVPLIESFLDENTTRSAPH
jgi:poly(3-hydroxyalkanoate) depolymerase